MWSRLPSTDPMPPFPAGHRPLSPRASRRGRKVAWSLILALTLSSLPVGPSARGEDWESIAPGVDYRLFLLDGPNRLHAARLDTREPSVIIESSLALGGLAKGFETVSGMARRYDGELLAWGDRWGTRGRVLVAINGSSFDPETTQPYGGLFHSGEYARRYGDLAGGTGFVWTDDREGVIRGCVNHAKTRQLATRLADGSTFEIDAVNLLRDDDGLILFTPQYAAATPHNRSETEAVLQLEAPLGTVPPPKYAEAVVLEIREGSGETPLYFDQVVLAGQSRAADFLHTLHPGERIGISQEITDLGFGCRGDGGFDWTDVYAGIGGGFVFLRDGEIFISDDSGEDAPDPRTAICLDDRYVYFIVVDGRDNDVSIGMSLEEMAQFCRDELGAKWGLNQDGGGSSAMWVNGRVVNTPSDGSERPVANGLMMVAVEPPAYSRRFAEGFVVQVQAHGQLRPGPGANQPILDVAAPGEEVRIAATAPSLAGVFASGSYWWKVIRNGEFGWMPEQALVVGDAALSLFQMPDPPRAIPEATTP